MEAKSWEINIVTSTVCPPPPKSQLPHSVPNNSEMQVVGNQGDYCSIYWTPSWLLDLYHGHHRGPVSVSRNAKGHRGQAVGGLNSLTLKVSLIHLGSRGIQCLNHSWMQSCSAGVLKLLVTP